MTDRYGALTVILETDIRVDDAQALIDAIRQLRGVLDVQGNISNFGEYMIAERRIRSELTEKIWQVLTKDRP